MLLYSPPIFKNHFMYKLYTHLIHVVDTFCFRISLFKTYIYYNLIFRSTLQQSGPNKAGLKCLSMRTYIRTSICPQTVWLISMKFGL